MQIQQTWVQPREPVWVHKNQQFIKAVIKQVAKQMITCTMQSGDIVRVKRVDIYHRNPLASTNKSNDLMENDIINEPEILSHLENRFKEKFIYTFVQNTLIAVNPYFMINELYTQEVKDHYIGNIIENGKNLKDQQPHIYAITATMVRRLFEDNCSQTVIISGQSGAGKTEVNKQCLRFLSNYFKKLNQKKKDTPTQSNIQRAIMLSNPILQAFGNSKTIRNNNSSRFGKYLSILVDKNTKQIKHAQILNYLLQKSRIISRSKEEQNFHIFYEFLINTTTAEKHKYFLFSQENGTEMTFQDFVFLRNDQMKQYSQHPEISFQKIRESLKILPDPKSLEYLCKILSAILHLGNLEPYQDDNLDYCQIMPEESFLHVCELLEIQRKYLFEALTSYNIRIGGENVIKWFSKREVQQLIHSLSKSLYQNLFRWIITQINKVTKTKQSQQNLISLGFLDIYGFEVLKVNSLEQLFINYTNQRLHQIYLQKIFKLEKQEFKKQGLENKFKEVRFQDNIKVIELLDFEKLSVFNLLDEESTIASPDQSNFITKIRFNHKKHQKFPSSNLNLLSTQFIIRHTPQDIQYSILGFRDKNRDLLRQQIKITMRASKLRILKQMFIQQIPQAEPDLKTHRIRKFLSSKFRRDMNQLMEDLLSKSQQLFIRCVKSNGNKKPMEIQQEIVYSQIKYLGILDTIRIKKMGYSIKIKYEQFDRRFCWLVRTKSVIEKASNKEISQAIRKFLPKFGEEEILYGFTKVLWKDYAFSVFLQKYGFYLLLINQSAHKLTNFFVRVNYLRKRQRKNKHKKIIVGYLKSFLLTKNLKRTLKNIKRIQKSILSFLSFRSRAKKLQSIQTVQAYIRRTIESKQRIKRIHMIEKVIYKMKFLLLKKKVRSRIVVAHVLDNVIMKKFWNTLRNKNIGILSKYVNAFKVKIVKREYISLAGKNQRNAIQGKCLQSIEKYVLGCSAVLKLKKVKKQICSVQCQIKSFLARRKYKKTLKDIINVQRAIRQYMFLKKGAKDLFQHAYTTYEQTLKTQSNLIKSKLYESQKNQASEMTFSLKKFLTKFKEKISLLYLLIDFESFIDLEIVYPQDSWILNFCQVFEEGLEKNDPIQYISVGETFTIAANTTKMYLWGLHQSFKNKELDAICTVKTKLPVQSFQINKNKLNYTYVKQEETQRKVQAKGFKISSTVTRDFNLQNGKLYQCLPNQLRLFKQIPSSQRVLQISCGKAHTILRTSAKKVYTFGIGRQGQLGHSSFNSEQRPRSIKYFQNIKTSSVIQVMASFTSSLVLFSNRKLYWFGKNGTLNEVSTPTLFELRSKLQILNGNQFSIARVLSTWSRTLSVTGITLICYNKRFQTNLSLRNKTTEVLISKWQESGIHNINPPLIPSVSDHLQQCHVKLRNKKINIYPESKTTLKQMQEKVKSIGSFHGLESATNRNSIGTEFSFANTQRNSFQR